MASGRAPRPQRPVALTKDQTLAPHRRVWDDSRAGFFSHGLALFEIEGLT